MKRVVLDTNVTISAFFWVIVADPTDNIFLECAIDGRADYIISGDSHLLNLGEYTGIQILKPKEFLIKGGWIMENQTP